MSLALACGLGANPALGQLRLTDARPVFAEGDQGNIYVEWDGSETLTGGALRLPGGWKLVDVAVVRAGRRHPASWSLDADDAVYRITSEDPETGPQSIVLKLSAPKYASRGMLSLTPSVTAVAGEEPKAELALALQEALSTEPSHVDESNMMAVFGGSSRIELRGRRLPVFTGDRSYTAEFWLKTTGLDQVIMSTWDGDEEAGYPIEIEIAPDGRLQYYRGEPGRHLSMSSGRPVADGQWHHMAVVHDEVRGWTRLLIDGAPADSLFGHTDPTATRSNATLCLGGRCVRESDTSGPRSSGFVGNLDFVRFWPTARTIRQISASLGENIPQVAGMVALGFEESMSRDLVLSGAQIPRKPSDFLFYDPVENLSASMDGGTVLVKWESSNRNTASFVVERSSDGFEFLEIGKTVPDRSVTSFDYADDEAPEGVIYYRIKQILSNGAIRSSGTLKAGLGGEELPSATSTLIANFPNPFSGQTTIRYEVVEPEYLSVSVWDLSGQRVALLAEGVASPGIHEVLFVAGDLPSGMYFVRLQTDEVVRTKTLTLTR